MLPTMKLRWQTINNGVYIASEFCAIAGLLRSKPKRIREEWQRLRTSMPSTHYSGVHETNQVSVRRDHITNRKRINQYDVVDEINHGVHGKVKLAHNTLTNEKVALKVMRRAAHARRATDAIGREIAVLKRVHHANIISCFEVIDDRSHPKVYLALEYAGIGRLPWRRIGQDRVCRDEWDRIQYGMIHNATEKGSGQSLSTPYKSLHGADIDNWKREPFMEQLRYVPCITLEQARHIIVDVVLGLEYLHAHGIVHRDIKPANLLWTNDYRVKIADFSTAFVDRLSHDAPFGDPSTMTNGDYDLFDSGDGIYKTVGTPGFIAPELCCMTFGGTDLETFQRVDIWSLGVTLYCLIFARLPYVADNEYQVYKKMAALDVYVPTHRLRPVPPSADPPGLTTLLMGEYRGDGVIEHENLGEALLHLLHRMLTRNPRNRIRLADIKAHPWLAQVPTDHPRLRMSGVNIADDYNIGLPAFW